MDANDRYNQYGQSNQCTNTEFGNCQDGSTEACSGVAFTNYVYQIVPGIALFSLIRFLQCAFWYVYFFL